MKTLAQDTIGQVIEILEKVFNELDENNAREYQFGTRLARAVEMLRPSALPDWTESRGRADSSRAFDTIVHAVGLLIRGQASALINGRVDSVARLIVAQLAHVWKLVPVEDPVCEHRDDQVFAVPCPKCGRSTDWSAE